MPLDPGHLAKASRRAARGTLLRARNPLIAAYRNHVLRRGLDVTDVATARRCLVVAPHPDDETIGCGATIARKRDAGTPVDVVIVTDGRHSHRSDLVPPPLLAERRRDESIGACRVLGVEESHVRFLGFEELTLDRCLDEVIAELAAVIAEVGPDEVLVTSDRDWHVDHQAVHRATLAAVERLTAPPDVATYPVWSWANGPWRTMPTAATSDHARALVPDLFDALALPRARLVSTSGYADRKREAFRRYVTQTTNVTGEPTWATFAPDWLDPFVGPYEVFFPASSNPAAPGDQAPRQPAGGDRAEAPGFEAWREPLEELHDDFGDERPLGTVVGSATGAGAPRQGIDVEGSIGVDNGALRLATLDTIGWGRQAVAYGPFERRDGLTLTVDVLNSHNTAQTNILREGRKAKLGRFVRGFPDGQYELPTILDNLAVGFQPRAVPADPTRSGSGFVMHAAGVVNGEPRVRVGTGMLRVHAGVQEVPLRYVVVLRARGALCFLSSLPLAAGTAAYPLMRPVAIDHAASDPQVWAVLTQAVHGEVFHEIDTRVGSVDVREVPELAGWASAVAADTLRGHGPLAATRPERGPGWTVLRGALERTDGGLVAADASGAEAVCALPEPPGLVHVVAHSAARFAETGCAGVRFRTSPEGAEGWRVTVYSHRAELTVTAGGTTEVVAECATHLPAASAVSLHVIDDGRRFAAHLDGHLLFDRWFEDDRLAHHSGVGIVAGPRDRVALTDFEAHPRAVPIPEAIDPGPPWHERGTTVEAQDHFEGAAGELAARSAGWRPGAPSWERSIGRGHFDLTGAGAVAVRASRANPNPGRTAYTIPWSDPGFADLEVEVLPPGTAQRQGQGCRAGFVFYENDDTYLVLNAWLDDSPDHDGSSVSLFFRDHGYERLYDAVWTNVGRVIHWGVPFRLRAACDGHQILVWLDDEPVLYRRTTDIYPSSAGIKLTRVGLAANWEWGDDTGSEFRGFVARAR